MFDPRVSVRVFGMRVATRASSVGVLAIVGGGVLARLDGGLAAAGQPVAWAAGALVGCAALGLALLAREAARLWVCRHFGVGVRRVDLYLFGGSLVVVDDTSTPRAETLSGIAGLLTLGLVVAVLAMTAVMTRGAPRYLHLPLKAVAIAGAAVVVLQAMPALPLDGGRILRAWLWFLTDDPMAGTRTAALYGHVIAAGLIGLGVKLVALDEALPFWGLGAVVAGLHLMGASRQVVRRSTWQRFSRGLRLRDAALGVARRVPARTMLDDAVELLVAGGHDAVLLVTSADGAVLGVLRIGNLRGSRRAEWDRRTVADVMTPLPRLPRLAADLTVFDAVALLDERRETVAVVEEAGALFGVVTREQLIGRLFERSQTGGPES